MSGDGGVMVKAAAGLRRRAGTTGLSSVSAESEPRLRELLQSRGALQTLLASRRFAESPVPQEQTVLNLRLAYSARQHYKPALPDGADAGVSRVDIPSILPLLPQAPLFPALGGYRSAAVFFTMSETKRAAP